METQNKLIETENKPDLKILIEDLKDDILFFKNLVERDDLNVDNWIKSHARSLTNAVDYFEKELLKELDNNGD